MPISLQELNAFSDNPSFARFGVDPIVKTLDGAEIR